MRQVAGRAFGEPVAQHVAAGYHQLYRHAQEGGAGVYFARLEVNGASRGERRIVLVR